MKAQSKVQVRTSAGLVDAPCYHQWKQAVGGMEFEFALHVAAGHAKGFVAPLAISELSTGFDVKATITHPVSRAPLNSSNIQGLKSGQVKGVAHAALHNLLHKKVGAGRFLQAMLGAQMQLSKVDLSKYEVKGGLANPGTASFTAPATQEQVAMLDQMFGAEPKVRQAVPYPPVVMPAAEHCLACEDTKVLTTTDKDHEGQPIEVACTECIPGGVGFRFDVAMTPGDPAGGGDGVHSSDWSSPTEEEWYEGLEPADKLEHLQQLLPRRVEASRELTKRATKADYDRIDDMDSEIRDIEAKIKALTLDGLKLRLDALNDQAAQHGTMTGDLTDDQYEDLSYNICSLEEEIADLEGTPCSN